MTEVTIVGAGLAGMIAALRLAERGCSVSIFEASDRLGGKAGSTKNGDDYDDHGYHIFPMWYLNIWRLVEELGIRDHFTDCTDFNQIKPGEFPQFRTEQNATSIRFLWKNMTSGFMPFPEAFLYYYSTLDLISQHYRDKAFLDQITITGFLRSRFYRTERVALAYQDAILKALAAPIYSTSAMTTWKVMRYWTKYSLPWFRILQGNLQEFFITPIQRRLQQLGIQIYTSRCLERIQVEGSQVTRLYFRDQAGVYEREVDKVILAIPVERLISLLDDHIYDAAPDLANIRYLRTQPMAALNIYLTKRIQGLPKNHTFLTSSLYGLSFIDVSQTWQGYNAPVLNVIASDFTPLEGLSQELATSQMIAELKRYLPGLEWTNIKRTYLQTHLEQPLFTNDVGIWHFRPDATTELTNLFLAGDYCRSPIDLACMEGAVITGLQAAEALRIASSIKESIDILEPVVYPNWVYTLAKFILMPIAALMKLVTWLSAT